jgi:tellurite resistance protein
MLLHRIPAAYFGIVLGLAGLGGAWRAAHRVWGLPSAIGESLMLIAGAGWAFLVIGYAAKWLLAREEARAELEHPVQCCFVGLLGVATSLISLAGAPYAPGLAKVLFVAGGSFTLAFAVWRTGLLWRGGREPATTTPVLYLPLVAGGFVTAAAAAQFGYRDWAQLFFGAGLFAWLAIESVLPHRLYTGPPLAPALRPTLGIQLAPPTVGAMAYLAVAGTGPDLFARALMGYGLLQAVLLLRMLPWIREQPFAPSYWAFTFGATALATTPLVMIERGETGALAIVAPITFVAANVVVLAVACGSILQAIAGLRVTPARIAASPVTRSST